MADWWVDSASGANTNPGSVYTDPKKTLFVNDGVGGDSLFNGTDTKPAAGDTVFVLDGHDESTINNTAFALTGNGTEAAPIAIKSVASFNGGTPDTFGTKAGVVIGHIAAGFGRDITAVLGDHFLYYGVHFKAGDQCIFNAANHSHFYKCKLQNMQDGLQIPFGYSASSKSTMYAYDTDFAVGATNCNILALKVGRWTIVGGAMTGGGSGGTAAAINVSNNGGVLLLTGVDFSGLSSANKPLVSSTDDEGTFIRLDSCKTLSGTPITTTGVHRSNIIEAINCGSAASNTSLVYPGEVGTITGDTSTTRSGGSSVDGGEWSYSMVPESGVSLLMPLQAPSITGDHDFSVATNVDVFIANATRDLTDEEIWFELVYPTYNVGGSTVVTSQSADWMVNPQTITDDVTSTWRGTDPTYKQRIRATVGGATDGRDGPYEIRVHLAVDVDVFVSAKGVLS